jgi:DNA-binding CsgD family transcriptional regulator
MNDDNFEKLMVQLNKLTRVVALSSTMNLTITERILLLGKSGFRPNEIAEIVGTSSNVVNVRLSEYRKKNKRGGKSAK